jgi:predicted transporter
VEDLTIGLAVGLAVGFAGAALLRRSHLASGGLYPVGTLAIAAVAFGGSEVLDRRVRVRGLPVEAAHDGDQRCDS